MCGLFTAVFTMIPLPSFVAKDVFWSSFHCFVLILARCKSRLWPLITRLPQTVLQLIVNHPVYSNTVKQYLAKSSGIANVELVDSSQELSSQVEQFAFVCEKSFQLLD